MKAFQGQNSVSGLKNGYWSKIHQKPTRFDSIPPKPPKKFAHSSCPFLRCRESVRGAIGSLLDELHGRPDGAAALTRMIEQATDSCEFLDDPARHAAVVDDQNPRLAFEGFELRTPRAHAGAYAVAADVRGAIQSSGRSIERLPSYPTQPSAVRSARFSRSKAVQPRAPKNHTSPSRSV